MKKIHLFFIIFFFGITMYFFISNFFVKPDRTEQGIGTEDSGKTESVEKVPVTLVTDITDTSITINGEDQPQSVSDQLNFGELPVGTTIQGERYFYWGETKSKVYTVEAGIEVYDITANIPVLEDSFKVLISDIIHTFAKQRLFTLINRDRDLLTNVSKQLKDKYNKKMSVTEITGGESLDVKINFEKMLYEPGPDYTEKLLVPVTFVNEIITDENSVPYEVEQEVILTLLYDQAYKYWVIIQEEEL
ncbi:TcaA 3rd/4th domain-containing protein [Ornithinibacillus xuwenensis]|uniref:Regulatory protein YycH-like domain-containing protein n=1 Tax=Ornithinibacillus xuwenensis TaxID=3144668 RepID=A0ABU9XCU8_9BACI